MFNTVYNDVFPVIEKKYKSKVEIIFRQQVQPWHPSSTLVHEAGVAVLQADSSKFWEFSKALFDRQNDYFDVNVVNETRNQTYKRLAELAGSVGADEGKIYDLLEVSDKPGEDGSLNIGNKVTNDLKLLIKAGRLVGIHVSPTVLFDVSGREQRGVETFVQLTYIQGLVENSISSSFTKDQWEEWLEKNVA